MDKKTKAKVLELIKNVDLKEDLIKEDPDLKQRKWYKFGAYDALRILSETVKELPDEQDVKRTRK